MYIRFYTFLDDCKYLLHEGYDFTRKHRLKIITRMFNWLHFLLNCTTVNGLFFTILLILMSVGLYHCIVVISLFSVKVSGEENEWSNLLLWPRQDSDSSVVMCNAPTLLLYSPNSLKSLSLIQNLWTQTTNCT